MRYLHWLYQLIEILDVSQHNMERSTTVGRDSFRWNSNHFPWKFSRHYLQNHIKNPPPPLLLLQTSNSNSNLPNSSPFVSSPQKFSLAYIFKFNWNNGYWPETTIGWARTGCWPRSSSDEPEATAFLLVVSLSSSLILAIFISVLINIKKKCNAYYSRTKEIKRKISWVSFSIYGSVIKGAVMAENINGFCLDLEPMIRRVVSFLWYYIAPEKGSWLIYVLNLKILVWNF